MENFIGPKVNNTTGDSRYENLVKVLLKCAMIFVSVYTR